MGFVKQCVKMTLHVPAKYSTSIQEGVNSILQSLLFTYIESLNGVPLSYSDLNVESPARVLFENPCLHVDLEVIFYSFSPSLGTELPMTVTTFSEDHLAGISMDLFSVTMGARSLQRKGYKFDESWKKDGQEAKKLIFSITSVEVMGNRLAFRGEPVRLVV